MTVLALKTAQPPDTLANGLIDGVELRISALSHWFSSSHGVVQTLSEINLDVTPGSFLTLVGQSGCGKSTLLNILAGVLTPAEGTVSYWKSGVRLEGESKPIISYLTQEDRLLPWRSVLRNVELPLEMRGVGKQARRAVALELLERVGLGKFASALPSALSGGMRQRVSIARALSLRPSILLLDEPFGSLDAWNKRTLHRLLLDLHVEYGATTILVTHDVFEAISLSNRIVTLAPRPGRLVSNYDLERVHEPRGQELLYSPAFFKIYQGIRKDLGLED